MNLLSLEKQTFFFFLILPFRSHTIPSYGCVLVFSVLFMSFLCLLLPDPFLEEFQRVLYILPQMSLCPRDFLFPPRLGYILDHITLQRDSAFSGAHTPPPPGPPAGGSGRRGALPEETPGLSQSSRCTITAEGGLEWIVFLKAESHQLVRERY